MRSDMKKVVVERPRRGPRYKKIKGEKKQWQKWEQNQEEPKREKIRFKWKQAWMEKEFTDMLNPLYGYFLKQVGRKWDDVYSEVCQHLPANTNAGSHIRDHVWDIVSTNIVMIDDVPHTLNTRAWTNDVKYSPLHGYFGQYALYVHPDTKILCKWKNPSRKFNRKIPKLHKILQKSNVAHVKYNGVWYLVEFENKTFCIFYDKWNGIVKYAASRSYYDVLRKREITESEAFRFYGKKVVAVKKTQLSKRDIRKLKLEE